MASLVSVSRQRFASDESAFFYLCLSLSYDLSPATLLSKLRQTCVVVIMHTAVTTISQFGGSLLQISFRVITVMVMFYSKITEIWALCQPARKHHCAFRFFSSFQRINALQTSSTGCTVLRAGCMKAYQLAVPNFAVSLTLNCIFVSSCAWYVVKESVKVILFFVCSNCIKNVQKYILI